MRSLTFCFSCFLGLVSLEEFKNYFLKQGAWCETMEQWLAGKESEFRIRLGLPPRMLAANSGGGDSEDPSRVLASGRM